MKARETTVERGVKPQFRWDAITGSRAGRGPGSLLLPLAVGAVVFWVGFDGGTYSLQSRAAVAIAIAWALVVGIGLGVWPRAGPPSGALVTGTLLAAFALLIGLSVFWSESDEKAFNEFNRATLYLGAFAITVVAARRGTATRWIAGIAVGLTAVALVGLVSRLFPGSFEQARQLAQIFPAAERRLSYPVNYWNALGMIAALALPLLLSLASAARATFARGLALAPLPALAATIYLTSSRGAAVSAVLAIVVLFASTSRRWAVAAAVAVSSAASLFAVAVLRARPELVNEPLGSAIASDQGRTAAVLILLLSLGTGLVFALASRFAPAPPRLPAVAKAGLILVAGVTAIAGIVAAEPRERFETFKQTPAGLETSIESHLFSTSGNGRWQLWTSAVDQFEADPVVGQGAGSYEAWWAEHGTIAVFVRDAHSLYLEVLGELGVVGLTLLLALFAFVAAVGVRRLLAADHDERPAVAALLALLVAYAFEAGVDWMWELPAVSLVAFACVGLVTGPATIFRDDAGARGRWRRRRRSARAFRAAGVVLALGLMLAQAVPFVASVKVEQSREAVAAGQLDDALDDALAAREIQPWAATPHLQIALVYETAGDLEAARSSIEAAIERDRLDWRLWLIAARIQTKAGAFAEAEASLDRAVTLNPRSPLLAGL